MPGLFAKRVNFAISFAIAGRCCVIDWTVLLRTLQLYDTTFQFDDFL